VFSPVRLALDFSACLKEVIANGVPGRDRQKISAIGS